MSASYGALTLVRDNAIHYPAWVQILCLGAVTLCVSGGVGYSLRGTTVQTKPAPSAHLTLRVARLDPGAAAA